MLLKFDYMFSVISKGVQYEFNSIHQGKNGRNTLKMLKMDRNTVEI
jgi:hypothetical protein